MTNQEIFAWGAAGSLIGLLIVTLLPYGYALSKGDAVITITPSRVVGWLIVLVGLIVVGGLAALGLGSAADATEPTEPLHAVAYGLGWQSTVGGLLKGV